MAFTFDFTNSIIEVLSPQTDVDIQDLIDDIRAAEASEEGITYDQIASGSGKESLGGDVSVGLTVALLGDWQLHFWPGNYIAKVAGGNLVGGHGGDPIAYSAGVQTLLIQSAASTIVSTGEGVSAADRAILEAARDEAKLARQHIANKAVVSADDLEVTIYADDATTVLAEFDISADKRTRTPK